MQHGLAPGSALLMSLWLRSQHCRTQAAMAGSKLCLMSRNQVDGKHGGPSGHLGRFYSFDIKVTFLDVDKGTLLSKLKYDTILIEV